MKNSAKAVILFLYRRFRFCAIFDIIFHAKAHLPILSDFALHNVFDGRWEIHVLDMHLTEKRENENSRQFAYRVMHENIMTLRLKPGTIINESDFESLLGISRTPIREAIFKLKQYYLIDVYPKKASVVSYINLDMVKECFFLRSNIEPVAYAAACENFDTAVVKQVESVLAQQKAIVESGHDINAFFDLDNEFHRLLYVGAKKKHIWSAIHAISGHFERIRYLDAISTDMNIQKFYEEHVDLFFSILSGAFTHICEMYPKHLAYYQQTLPKVLESHSDYFIW